MSKKAEQLIVMYMDQRDLQDAGNHDISLFAVPSTTGSRVPVLITPLKELPPQWKAGDKVRGKGASSTALTVTDRPMYLDAYHQWRFWAEDKYGGINPHYVQYFELVPPPKRKLTVTFEGDEEYLKVVKPRTIKEE